MALDQIAIDVLSSQVETLFNGLIKQGKIPGAVVQIQGPDGPLVERAFGFAKQYEFPGRLMPTPEIMTTHHIFDLGSLTKAFATTFAIMLLVEDKIISIEDKVSSHLAEFASGEQKKISIKNLLTHTAGMVEWKPLYCHVRQREEVLPFIASLALKYAVGAEHRYSDLGFMTLAFIVERLTGQRLDDFLQQRLFLPLGLVSTAFNPKAKAMGPIAATSHGNPFEYRMIADPGFGYACDESVDEFRGWRHRTLQGEVNDGNAFYALGGVAGHAGLFSTANELTKLIWFILDGGRYEGQSIFSKSTLDLFLRGDSTAKVTLGWSNRPGSSSPDALGIDPLPPGAFGHPGFTGTYALVLPKQKISIVMLTNRQNVGVDDQGKYFNVKPVFAEIASLVAKM